MPFFHCPLPSLIKSLNLCIYLLLVRNSFIGTIWLQDSYFRFVKMTIIDAFKHTYIWSVSDPYHLSHSK